MQLSDIRQSEELRIYFNWTCNALLPHYPGAADRYFSLHGLTICKVAGQFMKQINYSPEKIYRGVILREPARILMPHPEMKYLSFSEDIKIAEHFADINGFGSEIINVAEQLGEYGYLIEYTPAPEEVLFNYQLLDILPYEEAFTMLGLNGKKEIDGLRKQKEIMIAQPAAPLTLKPATTNTLINI